MKTLKKISQWAGMFAFGLISMTFIDVILTLYAKPFITYAVWGFLAIWLVATSIRDGIKWYRKRMKPMVKKVNEAMDATGLTSRENEH